MEYNTVRYEEKNDIAYLTIYMPPANKMVPEFLKEIVSVIEDSVLNTKMAGVILTGSGRHFSSGADVEKLLQWIQETSSDNGEKPAVPVWYGTVKQAFYKLLQMKKPVIAAVNGLCIGSGLELALHTHIQILEENARVGFPESTFGLLPGINGTLRCIEKVGYQKALELIFKGDFLSSQEAEELGLIDYVVPKKKAVSFSEKLIHFIVGQEKSYELKEAQYFLKQFMSTGKE